MQELSLDFILFTVLSSEIPKGIWFKKKTPETPRTPRNPKKPRKRKKWFFQLKPLDCCSYFSAQHSTWVSSLIRLWGMEICLFPYHSFKIVLFGSLQYRKTPQFCFKHPRYLLGGFNSFAWNSNLDHQILLNCHKPSICQKSLSTWISDAYVPNCLMLYFWSWSDSPQMLNHSLLPRLSLVSIWRQVFFTVCLKVSTSSAASFLGLLHKLLNCKKVYIKW